MADETTILGMSITNTVLPIVLLALGAVSTLFVNSIIRRQEAAKADKDKIISERQLLVDKVNELETSMRLLKESVQPISMAFQQILIKELTHFHEKRTDELLEKIGPPYMLTSAEEKELAAALEQRIADAGEMMTESEIDAARMLPMLIKRVKAERALGIPAIADLTVVTVSLPCVHKEAA